MLRTQAHLVMSIALAKLRPNARILEQTTSTHVVKPWDVDLNLHLNNAKYAEYFNRAQAEHFMHTRYIGALYLHGWVTFIATTNLGHVRAIAPLRRFSIHTQLTGCDEKYVYCEQSMTVRGQLAATAVQRMAVVDRKGGRVSPVVALSRILGGQSPPPRPRYADALRAVTEALRSDPDRDPGGRDP
jgi:acyl-CoA thioesterase FadM